MGYFIKGPKLKSLLWSGRRRRERSNSMHVGLLEGGGWKEAPVPKGCLAVHVGQGLRRFVIPASYLCHPVFQVLMERAAEEFGFRQAGALRIPCDEEAFEEALADLEETALTNKKKNNSIWRT